VYENNIGSTLDALRIAKREGAAFVFMSSYVYGAPEYLPIDEDHPVRAVNPYMGSKIAGEEICHSLCEALSMKLIILRGFSIYGDVRIPGRLISDLLASAREGGPLILNDPSPKRDHLYIKDFSALILKVIAQDPVKTGTYNVGYGSSRSNLAKPARRLRSNPLPPRH